MYIKSQAGQINLYVIEKNEEKYTKKNKEKVSQTSDKYRPLSEE
jgi:hypothetical protein